MQNMKVIVFWPFVVLHPYEHQKSNTNSRKSVRWSAVPVPFLSSLCLKLNWEQGSSPKGVYDLSFHTFGEFSPPTPPPPLSFHPKIQVLRPKSQFRGPNVSLEVQILAWTPRFQPWVWDLGFLAGIIPAPKPLNFQKLPQIENGKIYFSSTFL